MDFMLKPAKLYDKKVQQQRRRKWRKEAHSPNVEQHLTAMNFRSKKLG